MNCEMLIITKESVQALKGRLKEGKSNQCQEELKRMLAIKEGLLWRAETAICCVGWQLSAHLAWEVHLLEDAQDSLEQGDVAKASSILEGYMAQMVEDR